MFNFTRKEMEYYSGLETFAVNLPLWLVDRSDFDFVHTEMRDNTIITAPNLEGTGLLTPKGISWLRGSWALRLRDWFLNDGTFLTLKNNAEPITISEDFCRFWHNNPCDNLIDAMTTYKAMRELKFEPDYNPENQEPYIEEKFVCKYPYFKMEWAAKEAKDFGECFEHFKINHQHMPFVDIVVTYIAALPYCWLMTEKKDIVA